MALPHSDTQETFDTTGSIREDLSDVIYNIDPTATPFLMMAGRGTAKSTKHEWLLDSLATPAMNAVHEGADAVPVAAVEPVRVNNHTQISEKTIFLTGTLESVDKAGRDSELSYQLAKRSKELKRDMEHCMVGQLNSAVAGVSSTPREAAAISSMFNEDLAGGPSNQGAANLSGIHISSASDWTTGGFNNSGLFTAPVAGTARPLLESDVKSVIQGAWQNGGDPSIIMAGAFNKTVISAFTGNSTRMDVGEDKRLVASIDVYVSDFGEHKVVPNRFQRAADVFAFTPDLWSVDYLRDFRQHALSKTGDSEKRQLLCEWTVVGKNQSGNGYVTDLTSS